RRGADCAAPGCHCQRHLPGDGGASDAAPDVAAPHPGDNAGTGVEGNRKERKEDTKDAEFGDGLIPILRVLGGSFAFFAVPVALRQMCYNRCASRLAGTIPRVAGGRTVRTGPPWIER